MDNGKNVHGIKNITTVNISTPFTKPLVNASGAIFNTPSTGARNELVSNIIPFNNTIIAHANAIISKEL